MKNKSIEIESEIPQEKKKDLKEKIKFSEIINNISTILEINAQNRVSMQTCFVTLLHLSNEHVLLLDNKSEGLNDFFIQMDTN